MKIKVCGITRREDLLKLVEYQVDYAGFIFYEKSPRFAGSKLDPRTIRETKEIKKVGVFVDAPLEQVRRTITDYGLDMVQLHGDETPGYCASIDIPVVKAFRVRTNISWDSIQPYIAVTDYFLFDTDAGNAYGGTGIKFNWELLNNYPYEHPFFLSGGIGPEQLNELLEFKHPALFAVDVNSKFETHPGVKDMEKVKPFTEQIQSTFLK
ncbi:phosphoribosylanthranilate isomerase [Chitinophaga sp. YR573]|uniref:phosphoribosylanthranilate isomerase n=1 Tax=Chitinophaga sp. YR573 TaxID=1881040 RepID=UPI0008D67EEC|nr:phosphoribosylanthranilate isomerase [Chitinophaga sp. YR573]SEW22569.1 phosphoribosylanthranilate isomerase [Chitinophaga sp. YR573]